jgi:hypothetical protein
MANRLHHELQCLLLQAFIRFCINELDITLKPIQRQHGWVLVRLFN